jgi:hypothetical protein
MQQRLPRFHRLPQKLAFYQASLAELEQKKLLCLESTPMDQRKLERLDQEIADTQQRLATLSRKSGNWQVTDLSLVILSTILRYRLITTSMLRSLTSCHPRTTDLQLRHLFDMGYLNRFPLPGFGTEMVYYLDSKNTLALLEQKLGLAITDEDRAMVDRNRDNNYAALTQPAFRNQYAGRMQYIEHELGLSAFHFMLERACAKSDGTVILQTWIQGPSLNRSFAVEAEDPMTLNPKQLQLWQQPINSDLPEFEILPHRPDSFFTLHYPAAPADKPKFFHFLHEDDQETVTNRVMRRRKFRAHYHYVVKQEQHRKDYGVHPIRAVITLTLTEARAKAQADIAATVSPNPSPLFWFAHREPLLEKLPVEQYNHTRHMARFLLEPERIFDPIFFTAADHKARLSLNAYAGTHGDLADELADIP